MAEDQSHELLYHHIESELRHRILAGEYAPGEKLPTEAELCEHYDVSRITVRRAIQTLVDDDMLVRYRGKGTYVKRPMRVFGAEPENRFDFSGLGGAGGGEINRHVLEKYRIPASPELAEQLQIPVGNEAQYVKRLGIIDGVPIVIDDIYVSGELLPTFIDDMQEDVELYGLLEGTYNLKLIQTNAIARAAIATKEEAQLLKCLPGEAVLVFDKVVLDEEARVIHYSHVTMSAADSCVKLVFNREGELIDPIV